MQQKHIFGLNPRGFHRLAYYEWGRLDAPRTLVCVHGLTRNARDFDVLAAALAQTDYRVVCLDVAGRGQSDWLHDPTLYNYPQYLADIAVLLARLDVTEVDWLGTSMGGLLGICLAALPQTPIKKLILNDVGPFMDMAAIGRIAHYIAQVPQLPDYAAALDYIRMLYRQTGPCSEADYAAMTAASVCQQPDGSYRLRHDPAIAVNFATIQTPIELWPLYDQITCPTLVLRGERSDVLTAATATAMTERGPRATLCTIPNIGHYPALMDAAQIKIVQDFLCAEPDRKN
jgi:pimeloyl-ACP methyl ester carboxylesterase